MPDLAPKITCDLQIEDNQGLDDVKHDIVYRANYIAAGFECANELIAQISQMSPLRDSIGIEFLNQIRKLKLENNKCNDQLKETSNECKFILEDLNNCIGNYIVSSIDESINFVNSENTMELTLGEMYEITK